VGAEATFIGQNVPPVEHGDLEGQELPPIEPGIFDEPASAPKRRQLRQRHQFR
jgi:hypothetical protein